MLYVFGGRNNDMMARLTRLRSRHGIHNFSFSLDGASTPRPDAPGRGRRLNEHYGSAWFSAQRGTSSVFRRASRNLSDGMRRRMLHTRHRSSSTDSESVTSEWRRKKSLPNRWIRQANFDVKIIYEMF